MKGKLTRRQLVAGMTASGASLVLGGPALAQRRNRSNRWWQWDDQNQDEQSDPEPQPEPEPEPAPSPDPNAVYLSDLEWASETNGWGPPERDTSNGEQNGGDGNPITLGGQVYEKGLGVHAYSEVHFALNGEYARFVSDIGIDDEVGSNGSVTFEVWGDEQRLFLSGRLTGGSAAETADIDIEGVQDLALIVRDGGDNFNFDHANWAGARVTPVEAPEVPEEVDTPEVPDDSNSEPLRPVSSIQEVVDNAEPGSTVTIPAGIYRETVYISKSITLIGQPGAEIRGDDENGNVVREYWVVGQASDVTIDGFTMRYASCPVQYGAITNDGHDNWTIQNCTMSHAFGANVSLRGGNNLKLINCDIGHGGQLGIHGNDSSNVLIQGNTIHNNNTNGNDPLWEAGGMKLAWFPNASPQNPSNIVVEDNEVYDNVGYGLWVDLWAHGVTFRYNRVHHNTLAGILFEVSSNGTIHDNVLYSNGRLAGDGPAGGGIFVQAATQAEIYGNVVAWNRSGIVVWNEGRPSYEAAPAAMSGVHVYENDLFVYKSRDWDIWALAWINWNSPESNIGDSGSDNWGRDNRYWHPAPGDPGWPIFRWEDQGYGWEDLSGFNQTPGDNGGVYLSDSQKSEILNAAGVPQQP